MNSGTEREHGENVMSVTMSHTPVAKQKATATMASQLPPGKVSPDKPGSTSSTPILPQNAHAESIERSSTTTSQSTREGSPRSQHSDSSHTPQAGRRPHRGCRFETGMAQAKRRVPYSLGPEKLDPDRDESTRTISGKEIQKLDAKMIDLYEQLLPSQESEERRGTFVQKLEKLLRFRWPGRPFKVSVFGSTGNCLGSSNSDIDICITTNCREIENVCLIAELLAQNGMQRIVCVSSAKVPIVKAWDPDLQVACDINVNNPIALENTRLIRSYIQIDDRVQPLAMIIKYWAKRRMLNDAALGGTLSSYTWICMVLNFLQTRNPPILPTLQNEGLEPYVVGGVNVAFDKDVDSHKTFGSSNTSTLGDLLFGFFKFFGHELDFENNAVSLRLGKIIPKSQKAWHLLQDNRLCVEEPFNTSRNLANTADDTSMRGIHLELRRAFKHLVNGDLAQCCEEYIPGPEEHKQTSTFIHQTARPIIPQAPGQPATSTSRNNRNNNRGSRNSNRNSAARRSSNPASRNPNYLHDLPFQMTPQELQLQAQHQQHLLHDQLFQQYQYLQLQEQELRMQLYQQSLRQRGLVPSHNYTPSTISSESSHRLPTSPSIVPNRFGNASPFLPSPSPSNGAVTNPASPLLGYATMDNRRFTRRTSVATSTPAASLRAQSQPARIVPASSVFPSSNIFPRVYNGNGQGLKTGNMVDRRTSLATHVSAANLAYLSHSGSPSTLYDAGRRPAEFMGYYVGQSPLFAARSQSTTTISPIPSHAGLAIHNGGLSPKIHSRTVGIPSGASSPSLPNTSLGNSQDLQMEPRYPPSPPLADGPLIIDGSLRSPKRRQQSNRNPISNSDNYTISTVASDDLGVDTPATSEDQFQDFNEKSVAVSDHMLNSHNIDGVLEQVTTLTLNHGAPERAAGRNHSAILGEMAQNATLSQDSTPTLAPSSGTESHSRFEINGQQEPGRRKKPKGERSPLHEGTPFAPQLWHNRTIAHDAVKLPSTPQLTDASSAWQTQKKKRKGQKAIKSEADASALNSAGGELLPRDESLRKGG